MKKLSIILMCTFAVLANFGKAEIFSAQELPNGRIIVNNDPNAALGSGEKQVKIPWMIVSPDGRSGFANDFTTNAISLVSEDGTNFYAHIETEVDGQTDRTKVIQFSVNKDGIPSKRGEEYNVGDYGNNRKLVWVKGDFYFLNSNTNSFRITDIHGNYQGGKKIGKPTSLYQDGIKLYVLAKQENPAKNTLYDINLNNRQPFYEKSTSSILTSDYNTLTVMKDKKSNDEEAIESYIGNANGEIVKNLSGVVATLPGAISGLSNNGDEVFATSTATNAFYNVTLGEYNVVKDENGNPKPMVPGTKEGLLRVIDNRKKNSKFLCVTAKGIHAIE